MTWLSHHRLAMLAGLLAGAAIVSLSLVFAPHAYTGGCPTAARHRGLRVASGTDVSLSRERHALIDRWNAGHPDTPATLVEISGVADLQRSQMAAAEQSHSCTYDVLTLDAPLTAEFAKAGAISPYPLPHGLDTDFLPALRQSVSWKGTVYALPYNIDVGLLYTWKKAGSATPPDMSGLLARKGGFSQQFGAYEGATVNALELIWGFQGDVVRGDQVVVDQPANRARIEAALRAIRSAQGGQAAAQSATEASSIQAFAAGQDMSMRNWPYAFRVLAADPRLRDASGGLRFGVSPLPGPTVLGGQNLAISAYSQKKDQAAQLIAFLTGQESERLLFGCGGFAPSRRSSYVNPRPCATSADKSEPRISPAELARLGEQIMRALNNARLRPVTPAYQSFSEVFRGCVRDAVFHGTGIDYAKFARLLRDTLAGRPSAGRGVCG